MSTCKIESFCYIDKNTWINRPDDQPPYWGTSGRQVLSLFQDEYEISSVTSNANWEGHNSPWPTPQGELWKTKYIAYKDKFKGPCFLVSSDRESEIYIHYAEKKTWGCFIIHRTNEGERFMNLLIQNKDGLLIRQNPVRDLRTEQEKLVPMMKDATGKIVPLNYTTMIKWIG